MSGKDHPPSTNGSPRLARRALTTSLAALGAVVAPVALVAATAGMPSTDTSTAAASSRSAAAEARLMRSRADSPAVAFRADAPAATPAAVPVPTTATPTTTAPPPPPPTTAPPPPEPAPAPSSSGSGNGDPNDPASWDRLAQCESGGNWAINTGNGYYGGLQFSLSSWRGVGGTGYPHEHPRETQIEMGKRLYNQGGWSHWPGCTQSFGWPQ